MAVFTSLSSSSITSLNPLSRSNNRKFIRSLIICSSRHNNPLDFIFTSAQLRFPSDIEILCNKLEAVEEGDRRGRRWAEELKCKAARREEGEAEAAFYRVAERHKVVALVAVVMCLCSIDRVVMSVAVVPLAEKYGWSTSFVGIVQSSFLWGYVVSSVIGGALADKHGGKTVMAWGVALWSLFTLLTPWAADQSPTCLFAVRALFGLAEGVAFPSMNLLLSRWFPTDERARAVGISMAGFQLGNVVGLCLSPIVILQIGITSPFLLFSSLGLLWWIVWVCGVTNDPKQSPLISISELQLIQAGKAHSPSTNANFTPIGLLLSKPPSWAIIFANITNNWGYFVLLSWMPIYFKIVLDVDLKRAAWFSAVPWGVMAVSSYIAGATSDYLIKAGYPLILVRKLMQSIGFIGPGVSLLCLNYAKTPGLASLILTLALSFSSFCQAGYFLNIQDIAPQSAGFLHGISNAAGTLAAIISTIGVGYLVERLGSFKAFLILTAIVYFAAAIFYNLYAVGEPLV